MTVSFISDYEHNVSSVAWKGLVPTWRQAIHYLEPRSLSLTQCGIVARHSYIQFKFKIQIQIQNSLLLPIYSFGHTNIQFVFKYNNIHT